MNIYVVGIGISFVLYIIFGAIISSRVKNANDFYVAGRKAPVILIAGSMIASYVSTGMFMGDAGEYYSGLFSPMTILATMQVVGYLYGAVMFGRYLRRSEVYTIPEFFGKRFCSPTIHRLATITSIITMTVYLLSVVQGVGTLMHTVTELDYSVCVAACVIVFAFITIISGASGVLITDTLMFGVFTLALVAGTIFITVKAGGWNYVVEQLSVFEIENLLSWSGNLDYMYSSGAENIIWGLVYGVVWMSVCMVGPWQSSRYLMAKNEHVVIRSALYSAFGIFILQLLLGMSAVTVNLFKPELESASQVMIWASMNILPLVFGVVLLTGVVAAGVSSATTFLSLIGTSVAYDVLKNKGKPVLNGRIAMIAVSVVILLLAIFNPPQIFWIMFFGGAIVASSWMPVAVASIMSKRVTKTGAFCGMLTGFVVCFVLKLLFNILGITVPAYLDPTVIGIVSNVIAMIIGSLLTKVTDEERDAREALFVIPECEKEPKEIKKTVNHLKMFIVLGLVVMAILLAVWGIPVEIFN